MPCWNSNRRATNRSTVFPDLCFLGFLLFNVVFNAAYVHTPAPSLRSSAPFQHDTLGLCEDYPEESRSLAAARRDLEVLRTNHIPALRIAFGWDAIEPEPGKYDWSFWDDFVRIATDEYHVRLIPYIC